MKIGLLGGSFNPIHNGHIALAGTAKDKLRLDEVWFIPTGKHPIKQNSKLLDFNNRLKLISKAVEPFPDYKISLLDSDPNTTNYTYNLVKKLKVNDSKSEFYFLIGTDILKELTLWHKYDWLLANIRFAVFTRPDSTVEHQLKSNQFDNIVFIEMSPVQISSTDIRERIKKDQSIKGLVPETIESEIYSFYRNL